MNIANRLTEIEAETYEISGRHWDGHGKYRKTQAKNKAIIRRLARSRMTEFVSRYDEGDGE